MVAKYTDHSLALDVDPVLSQDVACQAAPCHYPYTYHLCQAMSQLKMVRNILTIPERKTIGDQEKVWLESTADMHN